MPPAPMLSNLCYIIVVGTTAKTANRNHQKLLCIKSLTLPMDSEEKEPIREARAKSDEPNEPGVEILKSSANVLPSVHSVVAAASPLFSSYRSMFQNWKHSVPKLYKYPASDIEVVVYRKNGEVEKLSNHKSPSRKKTGKVGTEPTLDKTEPDSDAISGDVNDIAPVPAIFDHGEFSKVGCETNCMKDDFKATDTVEKSSDLISIEESKNVFQQHESTLYPSVDDSACSGIMGLIKEDGIIDTATIPGIDSVSVRPALEKDQESSVGLQSSGSEPPCVNENYAQTNISVLHVRKVTKALQVTPTDLKEAFCRNAASQKDGDKMNYVTTSTQTNTEQLHISKSDFCQTFPLVSDAVIQHKCDDVSFATIATQTVVEFTRTPTKDFFQTYPVVDDAAIQLDFPKVSFSSSYTQTESKRYQKSLKDFCQKFPESCDLAIQLDEPCLMADNSTQTENQTNSTKSTIDLPVHTVEWHTNVPCRNKDCQTDSNEMSLVKDNGCQVAPDVTSSSSQIDYDFIAGNTQEACTNTLCEQRDFGMQLSASCCYFTKRRERKRYEAKLNTLRNEIQKLYQNMHTLKKDENIKKTGGVNENTDACSEFLTQKDNNPEVLETLQGIQRERDFSSTILVEAQKYLDELGIEVDKLHGHTSQLSSNLQSLENTSYYEDDWIESSN